MFGTLILPKLDNITDVEEIMYKRLSLLFLKPNHLVRRFAKSVVEQKTGMLITQEHPNSTDHVFRLIIESDLNWAAATAVYFFTFQMHCA